MPRVWWTLIPRGGASLIRYCVENDNPANRPVPVTATYTHRANVEKDREHRRQRRFARGRALLPVTPRVVLVDVCVAEVSLTRVCAPCTR